ncbi:MAG: hypothetical protein KME49_27445 [Brasilonema octagenarum HA4186-MV1]|jgi:hypothetical protein|nr:hypothetical protein [Brasilonema octagenarum HA4186-MV1]
MVKCCTFPTSANFDENFLRLETALTEDDQSCAFTTYGLAVVLGIPRQTLNDYFVRLGATGNDPRKTLDEALAMGLKRAENMKSNSLYVFLEQVGCAKGLYCGIWGTQLAC